MAAWRGAVRLSPWGDPKAHRRRPRCRSRCRSLVALDRGPARPYRFLELVAVAAGAVDGHVAETTFEPIDVCRAIGGHGLTEHGRARSPALGRNTVEPFDVVVGEIGEDTRHYDIPISHNDIASSGLSRPASFSSLRHE